VKNVLTVSMQSISPRSLFEQLASSSLFKQKGDPFEVDAGQEKVSLSRWKTLQEYPLGGVAFWNDYEEQIGISPRSELVTFELQNAFSSANEAIGIIGPIKFEVAALGPLFRKHWRDSDFPRWGFGRSHVDHGWGCAFRGTGHDRLVSRRWLDFGPWRVIRRPDDTTFIQFHDLDITDPAEAYAQAAPGHERMGNSKIGGYLQYNLEPLLGYTSGLYIADEHTLEIVIGPGNQVEQREMMLACAERLQHRLEPPASNRIDHVAYIFTDRADAEAHLHELWLRELQCWYIDGHGKHRLDADYHPVPNPPAWVKKLDGT
jgi:hypothetical protein